MTSRATTIAVNGDGEPISAQPSNKRQLSQLPASKYPQVRYTYAYNSYYRRRIMQTLKNNAGSVAIPFSQHFNANWLKTLLNTPHREIHGSYNEHDYMAKLVIPDYVTRINEHYRDITKGNLSSICQQAQIPFTFTHFGVMITFSEATELTLHDDDLNLEDGLHQLIAGVGAVIIKNAYMSSKLRKIGHRNRFPHLNFHVDRTANQPTHYSMYARDPFDDEQQYPRTSSTLFIPNIVGHLQGIKEGLVDPGTDKGARGTYTLFTKEPVNELMQNIILEHRWDEPKGVGEISMLDNLTLLHASFYRNPNEVGYKIGVRYLA